MTVFNGCSGFFLFKVGVVVVFAFVSLENISTVIEIIIIVNVNFFQFFHYSFIWKCGRNKENAMCISCKTHHDDDVISSGVMYTRTFERNN